MPLTIASPVAAATSHHSRCGVSELINSSASRIDQWCTTCSRSASASSCARCQAPLVISTDKMMATTTCTTALIDL
jgi:hypothetical protein